MEEVDLGFARAALRVRWLLLALALILAGVAGAVEPAPAQTPVDLEADPLPDSPPAADAVIAAPEPAPALLPVADPPPVGEWRDRIDALEVAIASGAEDAKAADRLFRELEQVLWPYLRSVRTVVDRAAPGFVDQQASLDELYAQRDRLFVLITPGFRNQLEGGGPVGRAALKQEFAYLYTSLLGQVRAIQWGLRQVADNVSGAPMETLWLAFEVLLAVLLFRGWRGWSKQGLASVRTSLLAGRPPAQINLRLARVLWYLNRVNGPLSWLVLVLVLSRLVMPRGFEEIAGLVYTILVWILVARLAVLLIDAMAVHGIGGLRSERRGLRLRTLKLLAAWAVLLGLGLSLVGSYVGHGAIYAQGVRAWRVLTVPVVLLVIYWWRSEIFERLEALSDHSDWARRLASTRTGWWSYPAVVLGAAYLVWAAAIRWLVYRFSRYEGGRRALAVMVRRQVEQEGAPAAGASESAIPDSVKEALLGDRGVLLESVAREQLDALSQSLRAARGGGFVAVAERGGGKTTFLERLGAELGDEMRTVDCPPGGYDPFEAALAQQLGLAPSAALGETLAPAIEAAGVKILAIDNAHLLARPFIGGQAALDRVVALDARLKGGVDWLLMMDRSSWRYILLARGERALFQEVVELPAWSEEQLGELLAARCTAVGIEPDYTRFVLPRQLDTGEHEKLSDRNRFGYARILWELSDGNPEVAMRLFADSLRSGAGDRVNVHLPQRRGSRALDDATAGTLLILRVVLQCDIASIDDVARSLRISTARALSSIRFCLQNDWLEETDGGFRLCWEGYSTITRLLERRNLMPR